NPIDLTGQAVYDPPVQRAALEAMATDPNIHNILIASGGTTLLDKQSPMGKVIAETIHKYPEKLFVRTSQMYGVLRDKAFGAPDPVDPVSHLDGVPFLQGIENTLRAARALVRYAEFQRQRQTGTRGDEGRGDTSRRVQALEMVQAGRETIFGRTSGLQFGPGIGFGVGGMFVEVLQDAGLRVPPLDTDAAREMIDALKGAALLKGVRGQKPADLSAIVDVLRKF